MCARSDEVNLFDPTGKLSATAKWANAEMGTALQLLPGADGTYTALPETADVVALLRATGRHGMFLNALKVCVCDGRRRGTCMRGHVGGCASPELGALKLGRCQLGGGCGLRAWVKGLA